MHSHSPIYSIFLIDSRYKCILSSNIRTVVAEFSLFLNTFSTNLANSLHIKLDLLASYYPRLSPVFPEMSSHIPQSFISRNHKQFGSDELETSSQKPMGDVINNVVIVIKMMIHWIGLSEITLASIYYQQQQLSINAYFYDKQSTVNNSSDLQLLSN